MVAGAPLGHPVATTGGLLAGSAVLWLLVAFLTWIAVRVFDRERILTHWT